MVFSCAVTAGATPCAVAIDATSKTLRNAKVFMLQPSFSRNINTPVDCKDPRPRLRCFLVDLRVQPRIGFLTQLTRLRRKEPRCDKPLSYYYFRFWRWLRPALAQTYWPRVIKRKPRRR